MLKYMEESINYSHKCKKKCKSKYKNTEMTETTEKANGNGIVIKFLNTNV